MMKITALRALRVRATWDYSGPLGEACGLSPLELYPEYRDLTPSWPISAVGAEPPYPIERCFLAIDTDQGVSGLYGPIAFEEARTISLRLARFVVGEHPMATERIWSKMYRGSIAGRKGETMMAISKVDLALWDLKGKLLGAPVFELLGGPTRETIPAYASMLGYAVEPELAAARTSELAAMGFSAFKWFVRHGPWDGAEGIQHNLTLIHAVRQAAGPDARIMFDAWNSWDVPYTQRMAELAAPDRPWWFEEPVMPDMITQYAELRRTTPGVSISGGEHEYTRWGFAALLNADAVDILQPDVSWAGGLSEITKVCALASAKGIPVIPHHGGIASLHLIASQTSEVCPMAEWILQAGRRDNVFLTQKIEPVDGAFALPSGPGLGIELDEHSIDEIEELAF